MAKPRTIKDTGVDKIDDAIAFKKLPISMPRMPLKEIQAALRLHGTPRHEDTVFIAVDFEQWEFNQDIITEVGVTVLDTRGLQALDMSTAVADLTARLEYAHYRIEEYKKKVNRRYVKGWPENFVFGKTIFVSEEEAGRILYRIFQDPSQLHSAHMPQNSVTDAKRNIVLIGHSLSSDMKTAAKLGFTPTNVVAEADTQRLLNEISRKAVPSLSRLLGALGIAHQYLHNAGNDAAFTMQAMIGTAVEELEHPGVTAAAIKASRAKS